MLTTHAKSAREFPSQEAGSAGTLAGELPVELFAGEGAGAPGNGSWLQGFNARNVLSANSLPGLHFMEERGAPGAATAAPAKNAAPHISIGILAWNEEDAIEAALRSLFQQSLFANLARRNLNCEIICVANGCTDRTALVAAGFFAAQRREHRAKAAPAGRVLDLKERGKSNAWNAFVHAHSARTAQFLFLMDGDIVVHHPDTLWNMYVALLNHPEASVSVDQPLKDLEFKPRKTLFDRLSLATSRLTQTGTAQLTGQLYCLRAEVARKIVLPRDLLVEDGFIKAVVCTDFLRRPSSASRIVRAENASHIFQAYASARDILKNQKRQMIAQTITHVLVDNYLTHLPDTAKTHLARFVQEKEKAEPLWLKQLIGAHVRAIQYFWELFPGVLRFRFERWAKLGVAQGLRHLPATIAGFAVTLLACRAAHRFLENGYTDYWPDTKSARLKELAVAHSEPGSAGVLAGETRPLPAVRQARPSMAKWKRRISSAWD